MEITSKVMKFSNNRKIIEIPKCIRDNFDIGEEVYIHVNNKITITKCKKQ